MLQKCYSGVFLNCISARKPFVSKGFRALDSHFVLLPLIFEFLLWLIWALNIIPNGNIAPPLFHSLFHLSKFLLQKMLQNCLWDGVEWLWGYGFSIRTVYSVCFVFTNPSLSQIWSNSLLDTGTSI